MCSIKILLSFVIFTNVVSADCQSNEQCKYLSVIGYLRTNKTVNEAIKNTFPKQTSKKNSYVEFSVSDEVKFLGLSSFKKDRNIYRIGIDSMLIDNSQLYYNKFYFAPFKSDFLNKIMEQPEQDKAKFYLTFSKPIDSYLIVELGTFDPAIHPNLGIVMEILFKFNSDGLIEKCLYAWGANR